MIHLYSEPMYHSSNAANTHYTLSTSLWKKGRLPKQILCLLKRHVAINAKLLEIIVSSVCFTRSASVSSCTYWYLQAVSSSVLILCSVFSCGCLHDDSHFNVMCT